MTLPTAAAILVVLLRVSDAQAGEVYCFYPAEDGTIYVTPVFRSDDSPDLLSALYSNSLGGVGLSSCVTDRDEKDVQGSWQAFIDGLRAEHQKLVIQALPSS